MSSLCISNSFKIWKIYIHSSVTTHPLPTWHTGDDPGMPGPMVGDWSAEADDDKRQSGYHTDSILSGRGRGGPGGYRRGLRGGSRGRGGLPPRGPG